MTLIRDYTPPAKNDYADAVTELANAGEGAAYSIYIPENSTHLKVRTKFQAAARAAGHSAKVVDKSEKHIVFMLAPRREYKVKSPAQ